MSSDHGEPFPKRRRLEGEQNAAQQHLGSYSDTSGYMLQCPERHASFSSQPALSTQFPGMLTSVQFQESTPEASQMHLVGTEPTSHGPFGMAQPWGRASINWYQTAWGQIPYFAPTYVPHHEQIWHNLATLHPTAILPNPHHLHSQGVYPLYDQTYYSLPTDTTAFPCTTQPVVHEGSPSSEPFPGNGLPTGIAEVNPDTADSSGGETVCFGMVGFNYDVYHLEAF